MKHLIFLICISTTFSACKGQTPKSDENSPKATINYLIEDTIFGIDKNIDFIYQDKNNVYWIASNGNGVYRYDGKSVKHFTDKDGLCSNFVWKVQEDTNGNLWFETRDGICCFNGKVFTDYTTIIKNAPYGKLNYINGGLFFNNLNGVCYYNGVTFTNFTIHPPSYRPETHTTYRPYGVYCILVDNMRKIWFGTQEKGVCMYDGQIFTFIDDKYLAGPAVRTIFQDKKGVLWFGNNGGGLFRYDGKQLRNITQENNLGNDAFLKQRKPIDKAGSLARVFAINEDELGNIWIGTVDAGVWKYDGTHLTNFTSKDGLLGNHCAVISKDRTGKLWFVSEQNAIFHFDGQRFLPFSFK